MSTDDVIPDAPIHPDDPAFHYLTGSPIPRARVEQSDFEMARAIIGNAANVATRPDAAGRRWVPGLSIVLVRRTSPTTCDVFPTFYGTASVDDWLNGVAPGDPGTGLGVIAGSTP